MRSSSSSSCPTYDIGRQSDTVSGIRSPVYCRRKKHNSVLTRGFHLRSEMHVCLSFKFTNVSEFVYLQQKSSRQKYVQSRFSSLLKTTRASAVPSSNCHFSKMTLLVYFSTKKKISTHTHTHTVYREELVVTQRQFHRTLRLFRIYVLRRYCIVFRCFFCFERTQFVFFFFF